MQVLSLLNDSLLLIEIVSEQHKHKPKWLIVIFLLHRVAQLNLKPHTTHSKEISDEDTAVWSPSYGEIVPSV